MHLWGGVGGGVCPPENVYKKSGEFQTATCSCKGPISSQLPCGLHWLHLRTHTIVAGDVGIEFG